MKNGKAYKVKKTREGVQQISGKEFSFHPSAFDSHRELDGEIYTGHTYKEYYLKWTGKGFKQYVGKKISIDKFKSYSGSSGILKKIGKTKYYVTSVYKRSNGIININIRKKRHQKSFAIM